jgi:hypothetical protein
LLLYCFRVTSAHSNYGSFFFDRNSSLTMATGLLCGAGLSQRVALLRKMKKGKRNFTLDCVVEWVEKYENIDGRFCFFEAYACFSPLYQQVGKRLLSIKSVGSIDVECMAKPFKHSILTKDGNAVGDEKGIVLFRAGRISSISIMPAKLSKERCMEESTVTVIYLGNICQDFRLAW